MKLMVRYLLAAGVAICLQTPLFAGELAGKVVAIADGDTLTVLTEAKRQVKVRLAEIDTPERRQPYGKRARQALSRLVFGKRVRVETRGKDRYRRTIGRVFAGNLDVNAEMVRQGHAWVYRKYAKDETLYDLEREARREERGIWGMPEAQRVPPWEWRKRPKKRRQ